MFLKLRPGSVSRRIGRLGGAVYCRTMNVTIPCVYLQFVTIPKPQRAPRTDKYIGSQRQHSSRINNIHQHCSHSRTRNGSDSTLVALGYEALVNGLIQISRGVWKYVKLDMGAPSPMLEVLPSVLLCEPRPGPPQTWAYPTGEG
jgi:hypothetical protein